MDCCNVVQNELEDDKDRFCIVRLNLGDTGPKLGYTSSSCGYSEI